MTDELVEIAALAMANEDARQVDCPLLASVDEFRFDKDRDDYMARARAVLAAVTPAIEARVTGEIVAWLRERAVDCRQAASDIQTDDDLNRRDGVGEALVAWVSRSQAYDYVADVLERGDHKESQP